MRPIANSCVLLQNNRLPTSSHTSGALGFRFFPLECVQVPHLCSPSNTAVVANQRYAEGHARSVVPGAAAQGGGCSILLAPSRQSAIQGFQDTPSAKNASRETQTHQCQVPAAPLHVFAHLCRAPRDDLECENLRASQFCIPTPPAKLALSSLTTEAPAAMPPDVPGGAATVLQRMPPRPGLPAPLTQDAGDPQGQLLQVRLAGARGLGWRRRLLHGSRARSARGPGSQGAGAGERGAPQGRAPPPRLGHRVHGMPGVVVLGAEAAAAARGGPGSSAKRRSAGRSFPRPWLELRSEPPGLGDASARTLPPRRGQPRRRGRGSAPSGQSGRRLASGAGRLRPDARSGGCFKMAESARPSRPGAAAFWSRDCILYPPGRGRRRPPGAGTRSGTVAWDSTRRRERRGAHPGGGAVRSRRRSSRLAGDLGGLAPDRVPRLGFQVWG